MKENIDLWEDVFQNNEWGKYPAIALIKFVAKNFYKSSDRREIKILEIGSGTGANLWYMAREGFTVYGIDGSKTACEHAVERLITEKYESNIGRVIAGDYYSKLNDFDDEYFDAIVDVESLYCNSYDRSKEIIALAFRKLKKEGVMFSQTFADGTWGLDGAEIEYHSVLPTEGPMGDLGYSRYTTREDIEGVYGLDDNTITLVERQELHLSNDKVIKEWIIELKKD